MSGETKELKNLVSMSPSFEQMVKPAQEKLAESTKAKAEVAGAEKAMMTQAEADKQKAYQQAGEEFTQAVKTSPVFGEKEKVTEAMSTPFVPTQDTVKDIASLYSLVNVIGMAMGAGGKQNSMQAMHAMNGMLEGYQKGRNDLYKKEKDKFDVNMKNLKSRYDMLDRQLKDVMTLAQTDREAARQKADVLFAETGANFYKQMADKIGLAGMYEYHKQAYDAAVKAYTEAKRLEEQANRRAHQQKMEDIAERRMRRLEATPVGGGKGGKGGAVATSATQQQFENIVSADIGNAYFRINEYLSSAKDGKIPEGSKFLRDKGTQSGIVDAFKNYAINATLPPDLQKNDAALLGIAFDVVAARAFGRASGVTDAKIAQVVRQLPVEGDDEETKKVKMRILLNQLEEPNMLLPETKRKNGADYMRSPIAKSLYSTYAEPGKEKTSSAEKVATHEDVLETMKANGLTYEQTVQELNKRGYKIQGLDSAEGEY